MRLIPIATLLLFGTLACGDYSGSGSTSAYGTGLLAAGTTVPDVTLTDLDGHAFPLSSLRGKTVLLNFWFRSCSSCQAELPQLSELWSEVSGKRQDVEFLAVNFKDEPEVIQAWWKDRGFKMRAAQQHEGDVSGAFGVQAYPTNYVIGPDGKVVWRGVGYEPAMIRGALASTLAH